MKTPKGSNPSVEPRQPADAAPAGARDRDEAIVRLAPSRATVLLAGGSSEAKALVARALHDRSPRAHHPFITVDCATISSSSVEEVLFGEPFYRASTGSSAPDTRRGAIRDAEGGTLYLARIESLPLAAQPRFLRFMDEMRTGRVVVSSDDDLLALACRGCFRADLGECLSLVRLDLSDPKEV